MNSGYLPTRASSLKELEEFTTGFENYQVAVSSISNVVAPTAWPSRSILKINEILLQAIEAGFLNLESPETALNNANTEIAALIK
jgi:ABC-type glycerol-3-phosphate transport system substrate-binding protein